MKLSRKERTIVTFSKTETKPTNKCGQEAGYGPNPTGSDNAKANYDRNTEK